MAKEINCRQCIHMQTNGFTGVRYCTKTGISCHSVASEFDVKVGESIPAIVPDKLKACPGMEKHHICD